MMQKTVLYYENVIYKNIALQVELWKDEKILKRSRK